MLNRIVRHYWTHGIVAAVLAVLLLCAREGIIPGHGMLFMDDPKHLSILGRLIWYPALGCTLSFAWNFLVRWYSRMDMS